MAQVDQEAIRRLRERWRDPLLTLLTLLLVLLMFVLDPSGGGGHRSAGFWICNHPGGYCGGARLVGKSYSDRCYGRGNCPCRHCGHFSPATALDPRCLSQSECLDVDGLGANV